MIFKAPRVVRGQALTADLWNTLAEAVDGPISAPRDLTEGLTAEEQSQIEPPAADTFSETARVSQLVRIVNPEDSDQYVDVSRPSSITFVASDGSTLTLNFSA